MHDHRLSNNIAVGGVRRFLAVEDVLIGFPTGGPCCIGNRLFVVYVEPVHVLTTRAPIDDNRKDDSA